MQTTKYSPVQARYGSPTAYRASTCAPRGARAGREAPLVLIEEHLTDKCEPYLAEPSFKKPFVAGQTLDRWAIPSEGIGEKNELGGHFVAKVQRFDAGGYEIVCRSLDLENISNMMQGHRRFGKRDKPETIDHENIQKSAARAKRRVRMLTKNMGASHLVTFTRRETVDTGFASPEQWARDWDRLRRMIVKVKGEFPYVAVLEQHKKGNYHLHVAWVESAGQKVNLNLVRGAWWAVLGARGAGNVDAQFIKVRAGLERADKVARYISKYTSKHFEDETRFNKKRYWSSRQILPNPERTVMRSKTLDGVREEIFSRHGLRLDDYVTFGKRGFEMDGFFPFPDGSGFWVAFIPGKHSGAPPPF